MSALEERKKMKGLRTISWLLRAIVLFHFLFLLYGADLLLSFLMAISLSVKLEELGLKTVTLQPGHQISREEWRLSALIALKLMFGAAIKDIAHKKKKKRRKEVRLDQLCSCKRAIEPSFLLLFLSSSDVFFPLIRLQAAHLWCDQRKGFLAS